MPTIDEVLIDGLAPGGGEPQKLSAEGLGLPIKMNKEDTPMPDRDTKVIINPIEGLLDILEAQANIASLSPLLPRMPNRPFQKTQSTVLPKDTNLALTLL